MSTWTQQPLHSGLPGCYSDYWPVTSVGWWPCCSVWTCIPTSPRAFVWVVPLIMSKRVQVRVAGTALLDGSPDTPVTRQWKYSPRHTDLYSKLVWTGRQELFMTFWAFRVSNELHLSKKNIALIYVIHFSYYSTVMRTINMLFLELKYEIFGTWISGKFGKEVAWSTEFGQWVYLQAFEPEWDILSKYYGEKQRTLHTSIWEPAFSPICRSAHAWILPVPGLQSNTNHSLRGRKETPETSAAWILTIKC